MNFKSTKTKIIAIVLVCVAFVGIFSNLLLYYYFGKIVVDRAIELDKISMKNIDNQLNLHIEDLQNLLILCATSVEVVDAANLSSMEEVQDKKLAVKAQSVLNNYLRASSSDQYIQKLSLLNSNGVIVQARAQDYGSLPDYDNTVRNPFVKSALTNNSVKSTSMAFYTSIAINDEYVLSIVSPVFDSEVNAAIYIEVSLDLFADLLKTFSSTQQNYIGDTARNQVLSSLGEVTQMSETMKESSNGETVFIDGASYQTHVFEIMQTPFKLYGYTDLSIVSNVWYVLGVPVVVMVLTCILIGGGLAILLSNYITRPMNVLKNRIRRISENDLGFDPEIEKSNDEFGEMGRVVNEMTLSLSNLIAQTTRQQEHRKNIEIELLQSQINPHFLYNTLDSVYWIAVIQKNNGIAKMIRSLVNLLKNIAKGTQNKIFINEEISLLEDYIAIQSVRYLEMFEFQCEVPKELFAYKIVKLTFQPLVENAIFHGIEPTGKSGIIKLSAVEYEKDLVFCVEDNGVGMNSEQVEKLLKTERNSRNSKASINGMGVFSSNMRLKLLYGNEYGLSIESEEGKGTKIFVRVPKEKAEEKEQET